MVSYKMKRLIYIGLGVTWVVVGIHVTLGGLTIIKQGGKK